MGKKVYAVRKGRQTGIFDTWAECQRQVTGFSGAEFKSFGTLAEAEAFLRGTEAQKESVGSRSGEKEAGRKTIVLTEVLAGVENQIEMGQDAAIAYVDGSFDKLSGDFSYGMVILYQGQEKKFCQRFHNPELAGMHNVAGEIKGAEAAMRYALSKQLKKIVIYHDYEGIAKWCNGAWKANKEGTKAYKAYYETVRNKIEIEFVKVKGHSNDKYNDMADALAKQALGIGTIVYETESEEDI